MPLAPLPPPAPRPTGADSKVDVRFVFEDVSKMYRYIFSEKEFTEPLAKALATCFDEWVDVVVHYDNEERVGSIYVHTPSNRVRCPPRVTDPGLDVRPLAPIGRALANYRDQIAGSRDVRIANFRTGIVVFQGVDICGLWTEGQNPPDGSTFSGCVTLKGNEVCTTEDRDEGLERIPWPTSDAAALRGCFR